MEQFGVAMWQCGRGKKDGGATVDGESKKKKFNGICHVHRPPTLTLFWFMVQEHLMPSHTSPILSSKGGSSPLFILSIPSAH